MWLCALLFVAQADDVEFKSIQDKCSNSERKTVDYLIKCKLKFIISTESSVWHEDAQDSKAIYNGTHNISCRNCKSIPI